MLWKKPVNRWIRAACSLPLKKKEKLRSRCQQNHLTVVNFSEILQETDYFWLMVRVLVECTDWHFETVVSVYKGLKFLSWVSCGNQLENRGVRFLKKNMECTSWRWAVKTCENSDFESIFFGPGGRWSPDQAGLYYIIGRETNAV